MTDEEEPTKNAPTPRKNQSTALLQGLKDNEVTSMDEEEALPVNANPKSLDAICFGYCVHCEKVHELELGASQAYALKVLERMQVEGRLDIDVFEEDADPKFKLAKLFPGDRGHMFGVMECKNEAGATVWLKAYSSLPGGYRKVPGWVPMILPDQTFHQELEPYQQQIKELTARLEALHKNSSLRPALEEERKERSRALQSKFEFLYVFRNFKGEARTLKEVWWGAQGIPGGVGECCGPKLLNHAAQNNLTPVSVAEFFWGDVDLTGKRNKPRFRICCSARCQPIMGFLLCGLESPPQT